MTVAGCPDCALFIAGPPGDRGIVETANRWNALERTYPPKHGEPGHQCVDPHVQIMSRLNALEIAVSKFVGMFPLQEADPCTKAFEERLHEAFINGQKTAEEALRHTHGLK